MGALARSLLRGAFGLAGVAATGPWASTSWPVTEVAMGFCTSLGVERSA